MASKGGSWAGLIGKTLVTTALVLVAVYLLRQVPYVGPWVDKALKG